MNTVPVNSITTTRKAQKMEEKERKEPTKANMLHCSKHSNTFVNQHLSLSLSLSKLRTNIYIYILTQRKYSLRCLGSP